MPFDNPIIPPSPPSARRARRLPAEADIAAAVLAQALAAGHYLKTPADEQCPSGVWLLVPLDRRLVEILDLAGEQHADLEDDEREPDVADEEPSLGSSNLCLSQEDWSEGGAGRVEPDGEEDGLYQEPTIVSPHMMHDPGSAGRMTLADWRRP